MYPESETRNTSLFRHVFPRLRLKFRKEEELSLFRSFVRLWKSLDGRWKNPDGSYANGWPASMFWCDVRERSVSRLYLIWIFVCVCVFFSFFFLVLVLSMLCFFLFHFVCLSIYLFSDGDRDWEANYFSRRSAKEESGWQLRERLAHSNVLMWRSRAISFTFWFNLFFFSSSVTVLSFPTRYGIGIREAIILNHRSDKKESGWQLYERLAYWNVLKWAISLFLFLHFWWFCLGVLLRARKEEKNEAERKRFKVLDKV